MTEKPKTIDNLTNDAVDGRDVKGGTGPAFHPPGSDGGPVGDPIGSDGIDRGDGSVTDGTGTVTGGTMDPIADVHPLTAGDGGEITIL